MTKEELEKVVQGAEYDFLRENPHLGSNIMFLTLGGSHAYGTNVPGSDVDVRGVTGDSKYDLLGFGTFEQVVEQSTDTTIYGFRKLVSLLINCNPNVIEMLGSKPDNYLMVSPEGQMLLDNKALFLSKKALYSFGGYANDQLRRLQMGLLQNDVNTDMKEEFALRSVQRVLSGPDLQHNAPAEAENHFNISIGNVKDEEIKRQLVVNEKDEAKSIYNAVKNGRCKNLYCLTTDITPYDRERLLRRIRQNLKDNEPCVVISTSLIESGVDVDFPCGYRELSSLDSILQTAGRVNRNGLRDCNSCTLFVFDGPQAKYHALKNGASKSQYDNMGDFGNRKSITKDILQKYDADSPKAIHEYFSRLYGYKGDGLDKFDIVKMANSKLIPFQDISQKFKIIDEDTVTVIISQTAEASELVGKIRNQTATKDDIRKVGKYAVSVRRSKYDKYLAASTEVLTTKVCNDVEEPDICNLVDMGLYTNIGVIFDAAA